jgi:hypothetical protein
MRAVVAGVDQTFVISTDPGCMLTPRPTDATVFHDPPCLVVALAPPCARSGDAPRADPRPAGAFARARRSTALDVVVDAGVSTPDALSPVARAGYAPA